MTNLRLSEHFTLAEFERSATAAACGIDNSVPSQYIPVLQQLCKVVLEPLREALGLPVIITSGYRCNELNVKVGGVYASQHTLGEAADLLLPLTSYVSGNDNRRHTDMEAARKWIDFIEHNTDFDQVILETANDEDYWIHVSCRKNRRANRHRVIRYMKKK
ncbi:MAG: peptidase M15 [Bacteroidaceae bacterium]|nr:peptidase M15 [Bacteroidaceae bacterium]